MLLWRSFRSGGADRMYTVDEQDRVVELDSLPRHETGAPLPHVLAGRELLLSFERMNRVHPSHKPQHFEGLRHFVFTFHDDTFECVARGVELVARLAGSDTSPAGVLPRAAEHLPWLAEEWRPLPVPGRR
jgi:hypothetical protein